MNKNDYRNTTYCPVLENVYEKKYNLKQKIIEEKHRKSENFYELIRDNSKYKKEYFEIYNYKCAYCGTNIKEIGTELFELDHFKNKASHDEDVNDIFNIVLSCKFCNRRKSSFNINGISNFINPDDNAIAKIFYRDENYYIKIRKSFLDNEDIKKFYYKLKLDYQIRRLDFLLLNLKGLINKIESLNISNKNEISLILLKTKDKLQEKRNLIIPKEDILE